MAKGLPRSLSRAKIETAAIKKVRIDLNEVAVTVDGATGVGFGSTLVWTPPEGMILVVGVAAILQFTKVGASIVDTWNGDLALGTAAEDDGSPGANEATLMTQLPIPQAVSGVSARKGYGVLTNHAAENTNDTLIDNTGNDRSVYLNLYIDDADISADGQDVNVDGHIYILHSFLGD